MPTIMFNPSHPRLARSVDAARHAENAWDVHEVEGEMKADYEEPEMHLPSVSDNMRPVTFGYQ